MVNLPGNKNCLMSVVMNSFLFGTFLDSKSSTSNETCFTTSPFLSNPNAFSTLVSILSISVLSNSIFTFLFASGCILL